MMMMITTTAAFSSCTLVHLKTSLYPLYLVQVRWEWGSLRLDNDDDDVHHYCCFFILHPGAPKNQLVSSVSGPGAVGVGQSEAGCWQEEGQV